MKAKDIFTDKEDRDRIRTIMDMFNGKIVRIWDEDKDNTDKKALEQPGVS